MIIYKDLVDYTKDNHIRWDTDLFDVLKGFFNNSYNHAQPKETPQAVFPLDFFESVKPFSPPQDGEYSVDDLISLFST